MRHRRRNIGSLPAPRKSLFDKKHLKWFAGLGCLSLGVFHVLWNLGVTINGVAVSTVQQALMPIIVAVAALNLGKDRTIKFHT
jgi:drug/metabolite transporter (DMT)-like permease